MKGRTPINRMECASPPVTDTVEEGDRYVTSAPCCAACRVNLEAAAAGRSLSDSSSASSSGGPFLAVAPYSYVFTAAVKGRWLQRSLLELFVSEFAHVAPPRLTPPSSSPQGGHPQDEQEAEEQEEEVTSLNPRVTVTAYIEELCEGQLWLHGRESECRDAGRRYQHALHAWYLRAKGGAEEEGEKQAPVSSGQDAEAAASALDSATWSAIKAWLRGRATNSTTAGSVAGCLQAPSVQDVQNWFQRDAPKLLVLRQKDTVKHRVGRREGRLFADEPLHVLRCDLAPQTHAATAGPRDARHAVPRLLVVSKPCGLPVHPSGAYRKNSVTSILEDVFGGVDRERYRVVDHSRSDGGGGGDVVDKSPFVSIVHATRGFELVRVWRACGAASAASDRGFGLAEADLQRLLSRVGPRRAVGATRKRSRSPEEGPLNASGQHESPPPPPEPLKAFVVHRLDAATSGVLLFGLDSDSARSLATMIANKDGHAVGSANNQSNDAAAAADGNDDDDDDESVEVMLQQTVRGGPSSTGGSSAKTYVALVHGQVDLAGLARTQQGCQLVTLPASDEVDNQWLLLRRPIGCLSFHLSTYWSPGPSREAHWRQDRHKACEDGASVPPHNNNKNNNKGGKKSKEALEAKRARMRALTLGGRGAPPPTAEPSDPASVAAAASSSSASQGAKEANFAQTLKAAATLIRVVRYDPERQTTLVACQLLTGRTHQLRVHLASLGHPIVGDDKYRRLCADLGVREWLVPSAHSEGHSEQDGVGRFYEREAVDEGSATSAPSDPARGCICPHRICLHARRYVLQLPGNNNKNSGDDDAGWLEAVAPLPAWASSTPA